MELLKRWIKRWWKQQHNQNKNIANSESFQYKTSITGSTYNGDTKTTNSEGNEIDNSAYDANKSVTKGARIVPLKYFN